MFIFPVGDESNECRKSFRRPYMETEITIYSQTVQEKVMNIMWATKREKPVFGVSGKLRLKPVSSATETS